jgi:RecA/RadA recombinase
MLNVALSGHWDGGLMYGITIIAGKSRYFKTQTGLHLVKGFQDKYPEGVVILLDSELGQGIQSMVNIGIDVDKIVHIPVTNIEDAKIQVVSMLESIKEGDKVMFFYDSIGNSASKKELEDAIEGKSVADMSRAKALKSFFRIITPMINLNKVYFVGINHTYDTIEMFAKQVMGGGQGAILSADTIFFMGRRSEKDGKELQGYNFMFRVEKSRFVKEGSVFPLNVSFEEGVDKFSGLFDVAMELGFIESPSKGWYTRKKVQDDKKWRMSELDRNEEFWKPIIEDEEFKALYEKKYTLC